MTDSKTNVLILNNNKYYLDKVIRQGNAGPVIAVNRADINDDTLPEHTVSLVTNFPIVDNGIIIFYKQNGKYTILTGKDTAKTEMVNPKYNGTLTGNLISSVALKKTKIE